MSRIYNSLFQKQLLSPTVTASKSANYIGKQSLDDFTLNSYESTIIMQSEAIVHRTSIPD